MTLRTIAVIGLVVFACVALIALSELAREFLAPAFRGLQGHEWLAWVFRLGRLPVAPLEPFRRGLAGWRVAVSVIATYTFLYLAGLLALFAFPRRLRVVRDAFGRSGGAILSLLGIGATAAVAVLFLALLGIFTLAVFPLPVILPLAFLLVVWLGLVALALFLGQRICHWAGLVRATPLADLALGSLVIFSLGRVPIAGWIITALLAALGLGAVIATRLGAGGAWSLDEFTRIEESTA